MATARTQSVPYTAMRMHEDVSSPLRSAVTLSHLHSIVWACRPTTACKTMWKAAPIEVSTSDALISGIAE